MPFTRTQIANMALGHIGTYRINAYTEDSNEAVAVREVYERVKLDLLASAPWDFAIDQQQLGRVGATPVTRYTYAYNKPTNWLRTVALSEYSDMGIPLLEYRDIAGTIQTNAEYVFMEYVSSAAGEEVFSVPFVTAFTFGIAVECCKKINASDQQKDYLAKQFDREKVKALMLEAMHQPPIAIPPSSWATARRGR